MKKLVLSTLCAACSMMASAQITLPQLEIRQSGDMSPSIPKEFSYDKNPILVVADSMDSEWSRRYLLMYNSNLELVKRVEFESEYEREYTLEYRLKTRQVKSISPVSSWESYFCYSYSELLNMMLRKFQYHNPENLFEETPMGNGDIKITYKDECWGMYANWFTEQMFVGYNTYGVKYPREYFINRGGEIFRVQIDYKIEYTDWKDEGTYNSTSYETVKPMRLYNININNTNPQARNYFLVTQTLFDDDEKYEYLLPKYELTEDGDDELSSAEPSLSNGLDTLRRECISKAHNWTITGFQVMSEDGTMVKELNFDPDFEYDKYGYYLSEGECFVLTIGNKVYLVFDGRKAGKRCSAFYLVKTLAPAAGGNADDVNSDGNVDSQDVLHIYNYMQEH